ncbi:hypothetical protein [Lysobacter antibioticus]|uniref:hypothetical protein n=1 Tax=Lysobacter antibioticus TaxID=84531 RepID=UPI00118745B5|nr:hypothetical protein [Lysobacter antibioticus]
MSLIEAACFRRVGAARAATAPFRSCGASLTSKIKIWIQIKRQQLPPLKRRVTFFCHKQQKKGNQRKMLFFESQARTSAADAGLFHTGHPCPDEKRPASMRAALRVFYRLRECGAAHSNSKIFAATATATATAT